MILVQDPDRRGRPAWRPPSPRPASGLFVAPAAAVRSCKPGRQAPSPPRSGQRRLRRPDPTPSERGVERFRLANGLKVILRPIKGSEEHRDGRRVRHRRATTTPRVTPGLATRSSTCT